MDTGKLTHLSLFTGIGGLDIAAEWAGFQTVGQCEWADYPTQILEQHWPGLPRWRDIRTLTKEGFYARTGRWTVDVVSGGFPCQPFSLAGARRGTEDDRYLWPELLRVVSELKPTWVIGENVAGLVSMVQSSQKIGVESRSINRFESEDHYEAVWARQENMLLVALLRALEHIGYEVQPFVIPACAVGAAHRRDRIAIVAHAKHAKRREERGSCDRLEERHNGISQRPQSADRPERGQDGVYPAETGESAQCRAGGCRTDVADTQRVGWRADGDCPHADEKWDNTTQEQGGRAELREARPGSGTLCDPVRQGFSDGAMWALGGAEAHAKSERPDRRSAQPGVGGVADGLPPRVDSTWDVEPDIPRITRGGPNRIDRLKCLGNAVVPQQFYPIFAAIAAIERRA